MLLIIGNTTPPARAVLEGVAGDNIRSNSAVTYPSRRVVPPNFKINQYARRFPKPVVTKAALKVNALNTSHVVPEEKPLSTSIDLTGESSNRATVKHDKPTADSMITGSG